MLNNCVESSGTKRDCAEVVGKIYTRIGTRKRPRCFTSREESPQRKPFYQKHEGESSLEFLPFSAQRSSRNLTKNQRFGLVDLFGRNRWVRQPRKTGSLQINTRMEQQPSSDEGYSMPNHERNSEPLKFFTLRMEHRQGGAVAKHVGEERFLLFRSDQAGAIAKVIFSSNPVTCGEMNPSLNVTNDNPNAETLILANAKVHVLFVKDTYRGFNLGGFLFGLCTAYLRERYCDSSRSRIWKRQMSTGISSVRCSLDAEEDVRRHNKLVQFYEHLGLRRQRRAKITFINNNDGETYRRIPMKMDLFVASCEKEPPHSNQNHFAHAYSSFLPAILNSSSGESVRIDEHKIDSWLIMESHDGNMQLHTTDGRVLRIDKRGICQLLPIRGEMSTLDSETSHESFQLLRISDVLDRVLQDKKEEYKEEQSRAQEIFPQKQKVNHSLVEEKELWMIQSSVHGTYMGLTCDSNLVFTAEASFWQVDENFCLTHTYDSPVRRQHHRRMWMKQSVEYVTRMRQRYSTFDRHCMNIEAALNLTKHLEANPFSMPMRKWQETNIGGINTSSLPSFRTFLFHTAELARTEGHPDWVQLVALIHGLASALTCVDSRSGLIIPTSKSVHDVNDDDGFDWTIYVDTRVMGCKASKHSTFAEFRHLNPDEGDARYNTRIGPYREHVGLEHVLLSWTGNDYMYSMLEHNRVRLPREAYAILKLFPLVDWHSRGEHTSLSNDDDEELKLFVAEFHDMYQRSHNTILSDDAPEDMSDEECKELWENHYSRIAHKYGAGGMLNW
mmetsp:Transcript_8513/g.20996  ORF Transcript_8513/g.20996 Transcript_8513/m.20996 type:complete len:783 (+) Transcript_8513:252-2600(+)